MKEELLERVSPSTIKGLGDRYHEAEVYVVYISEFDIFEKNRAVYYVESVIKEIGDVIDDGLHRIFVNQCS